MTDYGSKELKRTVKLKKLTILLGSVSIISGLYNVVITLNKMDLKYFWEFNSVSDVIAYNTTYMTMLNQEIMYVSYSTLLLAFALALLVHMRHIEHIKNNLGSYYE